MTGQRDNTDGKQELINECFECLLDKEAELDKQREAIFHLGSLIDTPAYSEQLLEVFCKSNICSIGEECIDILIKTGAREHLAKALEHILDCLNRQEHEYQLYACQVLCLITNIHQANLPVAFLSPLLSISQARDDGFHHNPAYYANMILNHWGRREQAVRDALFEIISSGADDIDWENFVPPLVLAGDERIFRLLRSFLSDESAPYRNGAAYGLSLSGNPGDIPLIAAYIRSYIDADPQDMAEVDVLVAALGHCAPHPEAMELLLRINEQPLRSDYDSWDYVPSLLQSLAEYLPDSRVKELFEAILKDPDSQYADLVKDLLSRIK